MLCLQSDQEAGQMPLARDKQSGRIIQINIYDHTNPPKELSEEASTVEVQFLVDFWAFCPSLYIAKLISKKGVMKKLLIDYCSAEARTACA